MRTIFLLLIITTTSIATHAGEIFHLTIANKGLLPHGKEVDGMPGDWLIRNDKVVAVIGSAAFDREANQMVSSIQGAVIDFTTLAANNDQLVVYYPQGARVDVRSADTIIVLQRNGSTVALKAIKYPTAAEPYSAETTYTLKDGESCLHVTTEYRNDSKTSVKISLTDKLRCDNDLDQVAPAGEGQLAFIDNKWFHAAYGIATTDRPLYTSGKVDKKNLILLGYFVHYDKNDDSTSLEPGATTSLARLLLTAQDVTGLQTQYSRLSTHSYTRVPIRLTPKIDNAFVEVTDPRGALVSAAITKADGTANLLLDAGDYRLSVTKPGHDTLTRVLHIPDDTAAITLALQPLTHVSIHVTGIHGEMLPAKIEFRGLNGTPDPYLGPPKRSNGAGNLYYTMQADVDVPLPPGTYTVIFSHGPEYTAIQNQLVLARGQQARLSAILTRCFSTPHWIIGDLHNHTTRSGDSNADVDGRIINMAAAGIEFAPATEHNRISDYTDEIHRLGLGNYIASAAGIELSGRPGPGDINHQTAFPLRLQPAAYGYGSPKTDKNPYVQMKRLYDYDNGSEKLMQHNHPNIGWLYFDRDRDGTIDSGFGTAHITDVLEVREAMLDFPQIIAGKKTASRLLPWLQMLNLGYRIYGVANSDNHTVGPATGSMFDYIYSAADQPAVINGLAIAREVKRGHVVISNGPFLDVRVNGALPGDAIIARDGKLTMTITVHAANWCRVNIVQVLVNGRPDSTLRFTSQSTPALFQYGVLNFSHTVNITLAADAHLIVVAYGENETIGMVNGGKLANNVPIAMANPIFVDIDGNGFTPNKDMLGYPLPTGKEKVSNPSD